MGITGKKLQGSVVKMEKVNYFISQKNYFIKSFLENVLYLFSFAYLNLSAMILRRYSFLSLLYSQNMAPAR